MSFDIWMETQAGDTIDPNRPGNCTYNLGPMFALAFGRDDPASGEGRNVLGLNENAPAPTMKWVDGMTAGELMPLVRDAIAKTIVKRREFEKLNPENGWGDYDSFLGYLTSFAATLLAVSPDAVARWSG